MLTDLTPNAGSKAKNIGPAVVSAFAVRCGAFLQFVTDLACLEGDWKSQYSSWIDVTSTFRSALLGIDVATRDGSLFTSLATQRECTLKLADVLESVDSFRACLRRQAFTCRGPISSRHLADVESRIKRLRHMVKSIDVIDVPASKDSAQFVTAFWKAHPEECNRITDQMNWKLRSDWARVAMLLERDSSPRLEAAFITWLLQSLAAFVTLPDEDCGEWNLEVKKVGEEIIAGEIATENLRRVLQIQESFLNSIHGLSLES